MLRRVTRNIINDTVFTEQSLLLAAERGGLLSSCTCVLHELKYIHWTTAIVQGQLKLCSS